MGADHQLHCALKGPAARQEGCTADPHFWVLPHATAGHDGAGELLGGACCSLLLCVCCCPLQGMSLAKYPHSPNGPGRSLAH